MEADSSTLVTTVQNKTDKRSGFTSKRVFSQDWSNWFYLKISYNSKRNLFDFEAKIKLTAGGPELI